MSFGKVSIALESNDTGQSEEIVSKHPLVGFGTLDGRIPGCVCLWKGVAVASHVRDGLRGRVLSTDEEDCCAHGFDDHAKFLVDFADEAEEVAQGAGAGDKVDVGGIEGGVGSKDGFHGRLQRVFGVSGCVLISIVLTGVGLQLDGFGEWCPCGWEACVGMCWSYVHDGYGKVGHTYLGQ